MRLAGIGAVPAQQMYTTSFGPVVPLASFFSALAGRVNLDAILTDPLTDNIDGIAVQFPNSGQPLAFAFYGEVDGRQTQLYTAQSTGVGMTGMSRDDVVTAVGRAYDTAIAKMSSTPPAGHTIVALVSPAASKLYAGEAYHPNAALEVGYSVLSAAGAGIGAYHGYKRHKGSVGWALWWGFMGGLFPVVTTALAFAQGINKPMRR